MKTKRERERGGVGDIAIILNNKSFHPKRLSYPRKRLG